MCDKITREYTDTDKRNEDIKAMYDKGYNLIKLFGDGGSTPLTAVYRYKENI